MARGFNISVLGDKRLAARFASLQGKVARRILRVAMRDAFKITKAAVEALVPSELEAVRNGLKLRTTRAKRAGSLAFRIFTPGLADLGVAPVRNVGARGGKGRGYYPMAWEAGWTTPSGRRMPPRSYLRAGLKATAGAVLSHLRSAVWAGIAKEARS